MSRRPARRVGAALLVVGMLSASAACGGDDDTRADSVPLEEWVQQFDAVCEAITNRLDDLGRGMTADEFAAFTAGSVTTFRALRPPDEHADVAAGLLDDIELGQQPGLGQDDIDAIDARVLAALTTLGVSGACAGDVPG